MVEVTPPSCSSYSSVHYFQSRMSSEFDSAYVIPLTIKTYKHPWGIAKETRANVSRIALQRSLQCMWCTSTTCLHLLLIMTDRVLCVQRNFEQILWRKDRDEDVFLVAWFCKMQGMGIAFVCFRRLKFRNRSEAKNLMMIHVGYKVDKCIEQRVDGGKESIGNCFEWKNTLWSNRYSESWASFLLERVCWKMHHSHRSKYRPKRRFQCSMR